MDDPKRLVADSYDRIHQRYVEWGGGHGNRRHRAVDVILDAGLVPDGGSALDLGCGTGALATAHLVGRGLRVTGVDISPRSIEAARESLPEATFLVADMAELAYPASSFDLVTAFYSVIHVPREEHADLFAGIGEWLRPGGVLLATLGTRAGVSTSDDWLDGSPMYWSNWDADAYSQFATDAGLTVRSADVETSIEDGTAVHFLWLVAQKSGPTTGRRT